jgi:hypothetical protein
MEFRIMITIFTKGFEGKNKGDGFLFGCSSHAKGLT